MCQSAARQAAQTKDTPCIEFWTGVPVSSRRLRQSKLRSVFQRLLLDDLIACASSRTMYCQRTRLKYFSSETT